jgi:hypothetical protein
MVNRVYRNVRTFDAGMEFGPVRLSWPDQETVPQVPGTGSERFQEPARRAAEDFPSRGAMTPYDPGWAASAPREPYQGPQPSEEEHRRQIAQHGTVEIGESGVYRMVDSLLRLPESTTAQEIATQNRAYWVQFRSVDAETLATIGVVHAGMRCGCSDAAYKLAHEILNQYRTRRLEQRSGCACQDAAPRPPQPAYPRVLLTSDRHSSTYRSQTQALQALNEANADHWRRPRL